MERLTRDEYRLSTGRVFYANRGIVGIEPKADGTLEVTEGYDGGVSVDGSEFCDPPRPPWTQAERAELATYMSEQWATFADIQVDFGPSWARGLRLEV